MKQKPSGAEIAQTHANDLPLQDRVQASKEIDRDKPMVSSKNKQFAKTILHYVFHKEPV